MSIRSALLAASFLTLTACRQDMHNQPRLKPFQPTTMFRDGRSARPLVEGTVARGELRDDVEMYTGRRPTGAARTTAAPRAAQPVAAPVAAQGAGSAAIAGVDPTQNFVTEFPMPVTRGMLERGRERFNIFCTPCHDYTGSGRGMIVQRGLSPPPSFHLERLKAAPAGHFFDVITNGYGAMYSYAQRVPVADRWAIIAYIRALQLSRGATVNEVPPDQRASLAPPAGQTPATPGEMRPQPSPQPSQRPADAAPRKE